MSEYVLFRTTNGFTNLPWTYEGLFGEESDVEVAYQKIGLGTFGRSLNGCDEGLGGVVVYFANENIATPEPVYALVDVWDEGAVIQSVFVTTFHDYLSLMNLLSGHLALTVAVGSIQDRKERFNAELEAGRV